MFMMYIRSTVDKKVREVTKSVPLPLCRVGKLVFFYTN